MAPRSQERAPAAPARARPRARHLRGRSARGAGTSTHGSRGSRAVRAGGQLLDELPPAAIDALVEAVGPGSGSPLLSLELRLLGGALTDAPPDAGALATLDHAFLTLGVGMVMDPEWGRRSTRAWTSVANALAPWDSGVKFANFVDVPIDTRTCYPPETFDRLQEVKARYDPDDLFRANHPIPSAAAAG